jgi:hypothetical protein
MSDVMNDQEIPDNEKLWERYQMHIDLYKYYMDLTLKINIFYYGITGAILSYYFTNSANGTSKELVLFLPIAMSASFCALFRFAETTYPKSIDDVKDISGKLGFYRYVRIDAFLLVARGSSYLMGSIAIVLSGIFLSNAL